MITLARASAIPARMASVYALGVTPPDFHAVAEVFLDGAWYPIDATGMAVADRVARIGVGRDAADIAFMTVYGKGELKEQSVSVALGWRGCVSGRDSFTIRARLPPPRFHL